jgi:hypothetical protein
MQPEGVSSLGDIEKLTVGHDNSGWGAGWHVKKIGLMNLRTLEKKGEGRTLSPGAGW